MVPRGSAAGRAARPPPALHRSGARPGARGRGRAAGRAGASAAPEPAAAAAEPLGPAEGLARLGEARAEPVFEADGGANALLPPEAGVYALYDGAGALQYIGMSRNVATTVRKHAAALGPAALGEVRVAPLATASKEAMQAAWKSWIGDAVEADGAIPPGNLPGDDRFKLRAARAPARDLRLTAGKGLDDVAVPVADLIDMVVRDHAVVAFIKGTAAAPECGFSHSVLTLLQESGADFKTVNCLDQTYNPGLREAIKEYSNWPTIPQVYVRGEFVGGADILIEMAQSGELAAVLKGEDAA